MFLARWRWNLNRSLLILRFRNGARTRRRSSAWRPTTSWPRCSRRPRRARRTSPARSRSPTTCSCARPSTTRCTRRSTSTACATLLERIESGAVTVHCADTTEPSVLAHEILTARPYAFLDDEELQNRRTNAVHAPARAERRPQRRSARSSPRRSSRCTTRSRPSPTRADDLHDLLELARAVPARGRVAGAVGPSSRRAAGVRCSTTTGTALWCTTERRDDAAPARSPATRTRPPRSLRGHLEISGVTTVDRAGVATTLPDGRVQAGLAVLENDGFALQGRYTRPDASTPSGWRAGSLARMHSYSRRTRRDSGWSRSTAQDFMRFLLRWQHVAPGTQLTGEAGLLAALDQLQGFEAAAVAWEPELLGAPDAPLRARSCSTGCATTGEVGWLRLTPRPRDDADAPVGAPSKATPISVVFRADLPWLLEPRRARAPTRRSRRSARPPRSSRCCASAGACFADRARRRHQPPARGRRARAVGRRRPRPAHRRRLRRHPRPGQRHGGARTDARRFSRLLRGAHGSPRAAAGRWSLVPATGRPEEPPASTATSSPRPSPSCCSAGGV